eukprot:14931.XXX_16843_17025_1 [CDS] Oithona nana genome sequencing.
MNIDASFFCTAKEEIQDFFFATIPACCKQAMFKSIVFTVVFIIIIVSFANQVQVNFLVFG